MVLKNPTEYSDSIPLKLPEAYHLPREYLIWEYYRQVLNILDSLEPLTGFAGSHGATKSIYWLRLLNARMTFMEAHHDWRPQVWWHHHFVVEKEFAIGCM